MTDEQAERPAMLASPEHDTRVAEIPWVTWAIGREAWQFMRDAIRQAPDGSWYFSGTDYVIERSVAELEALLWDIRVKPRALAGGAAPGAGEAVGSDE